MIVSLNGILTEKTPSEVIIDVSGIGYLCFISNNTYDSLPMIGNKVSLFIYHQISENNQSLYGFSDYIEKDMFLMLISVSGIGPKTGINLLSSVSANEFKRRLVEAGYLSEECSVCGWNEERITDSKRCLHLDYIDGDRKNKEYDNLRLLCPNCYLSFNGSFQKSKMFCK